MNKKGFTLIELVAVIVVLGLITLITYPNLKNLMKNNNEKEYKTIEDMMVNYVKVIPNYRTKSYICLKDMNLDIETKVTSSLNCNGYVKNESDGLKAYLSCYQNGTKMYETDGYNLPSGC